MKWMIGVLILGLLSCVTDGDEQPAGQELVPGDRLPRFWVTMNDGRRVTDADLTGQVSLVVFFHTSCKDCRQELPVIQRFYDAFPQYPMVCISREESESSVAAYWKEQGFTMPYSAQDDRTVYQLFARQGIPRIYVVDAEGVIKAVFTDNPLASLDDLAEAVD